MHKLVFFFVSIGSFSFAGTWGQIYPDKHSCEDFGFYPPTEQSITVQNVGGDYSTCYYWDDVHQAPIIGVYNGVVGSLQSWTCVRVNSRAVATIQFVPCSSNPPPPTCDPGQYLDEETNQCMDDCQPSSSEIVINHICETCPPNSVPNADHTFCECIPPLKLDPASRTCKSERQMCPDLNTHYNEATSSCDACDCSVNRECVSDANNGYICLSNFRPGDQNGSQDICPHPPIFLNLPFRGVMTYGSCASHQGSTSFSCAGSDLVACYYNDPNSSTGTGSGNDSNSSTGTGSGNDSNSSTGTGSGNDSNQGTDLSGVESRLDEVVVRLSETGPINLSVRDLTRSNNANSQRNTNAINNMNNDLGIKLDLIRNSIDRQNNEVDLTRTNDLLQTNSDLLTSIDDAIHMDHSDDVDAMNGEQGDVENAVSLMTASYVENYNAITGLINGVHAAPVASSGTCSISANILGKQIDLGSKLESSALVMRPVVMFVLNLFASLFLLKIAILAYRDVTHKVIILFS